MSTTSIGDPLNNLTLQQLKLPFLEKSQTQSSTQWKASTDLIVKLPDNIWGYIFDIFRNKHSVSDQFIVQESMLYFIRAIPSENELEDLLATNSSTYNGYRKCYHNILKIVIRKLYSESGIFAPENSRSLLPLWRPLFKAARYGVSQTVINLATTMIRLPATATHIKNISFYHFTELKKAIIEFRSKDSIRSRAIAGILLAPKLKELRFHACEGTSIYFDLKQLKKILKHMQDRIQDPDQKVCITLSGNYNEISSQDLHQILMNIDDLPVDSIEVTAQKTELSSQIISAFLKKFNKLSSFKVNRQIGYNIIIQSFKPISRAKIGDYPPEWKAYNSLRSHQEKEDILGYIDALIHYITLCNPSVFANHLNRLLENLYILIPMDLLRPLSNPDQKTILISKKICDLLNLIIHSKLDKNNDTVIFKALKSFLNKEIYFTGVLKIPLSVLVSDFFKQNDSSKQNEWINLKRHIKTLKLDLEIICSEEIDFYIAIGDETKKLDFWDCIRLLDLGSSLKGIHFRDIKGSYDFVKDRNKIKRFVEDHPNLQVLDIFFPCQSPQGLIIDRPSVIEWYRTHTDLITSCPAISNAAALHEIVQEYASSSNQDILTHLFSEPPAYQPNDMEEILRIEKTSFLQTIVDTEDSAGIADTMHTMLSHGIDFKEKFVLEVSLNFLIKIFFGLLNGPSFDFKYYMEKLGLRLNVIYDAQLEYTISYKPKNSENYIHFNLGKDGTLDFMNIITLLGFFPLLTRVSLRNFDDNNENVVDGFFLKFNPSDIDIIENLGFYPKFYALDIFSACESNGMSRKDAIEWYLQNTDLIKEHFVIEHAIEDDELVLIVQEEILWELSGGMEDASRNWWDSFESHLYDAFSHISRYENLEIDSSIYYSSSAIDILVKITDIVIKNKPKLFEQNSEILQKLTTIIRKLVHHDTTLFEQVVVRFRTLGEDNAVYQALISRESPTDTNNDGIILSIS